MSRWLRNVNTLLQNLDSNIAKGRESEDEEETDGGRASMNSSNEESIVVEDILARRRGLLEDDEVDFDTESEVDRKDQMLEDTMVYDDDKMITVKDEEFMNIIYDQNHTDRLQNLNEGTVDPNQQPLETTESANRIESTNHEKQLILSTSSEDMDTMVSSATNSVSLGVPDVSETGTSRSARATNLPLEKVQQQQILDGVGHSQSVQTSRQEMFDASKNKELTKLRRHIVKLNTHLEGLEQEVKSQRSELERAAERIEKDSLTAKNERERLMHEHTNEIGRLLKDHKSALAALNNSLNRKIAEKDESFRQAEENRAKEVNALSRELTDSLAREQDCLQKLANLEEEKSTLALQNSSLNTHIVALQNRIEGLLEASDKATSREQELEKSLDSAISVHGRQLSQLKAREAELEKTVSELVTALAIGKNSNSPNPPNPSKSQSRLDDLESELETVRGKLVSEQHRSKALLKEIEDMSQERLNETSLNLSRQQESDLQVEKLSLKVVELQKIIREHELLDAKKSAFHSHDDKDHESQKEQISALTNELFRQQCVTGQLSSEIATLRGRLRDAIASAKIAEEEALTVRQGSGNHLNKPFIKHRRRKYTGKGNLDMLGAIDNFVMDAATYLRNNALVRLLFILYVLTFHVWLLVLVGFHTHHVNKTIDNDHHHGPHQLIRSVKN